MNEDVKQMREFCQKWIMKLQDRQNPLDDKRAKDTIIVLLDHMHKRLSLLEGVSLRSLEDIIVE